MAVNGEQRVVNTGSDKADVGVLQLGLAGRGTLRWAAVDISGPLEEARRRLDLSPIAAVALGRSLAAASLLLRFYTKVPTTLIFEILGDGALGKVAAEVDREGHLRGLVGEPQIATPPDGQLDIGWAVGKGFLRVTRVTRIRRRYSSQVELVSGEIGKDLVHYLEQSEQIHSAALLGVLPRLGGIAAAGGLLIEALPGTEEEILLLLEANLRDLDGVSYYLEQGGIAALRDAVLMGFDREVLDRHSLYYSCSCGRDELLVKLQGLAAADLESVVDDEGTCEAVCAFCGSRYLYSSTELMTQ